MGGNWFSCGIGVGGGGWVVFGDHVRGKVCFCVRDVFA